MTSPINETQPSKALMVYYSLDGNTKKLARKAARILKCDVLEIQPVDPIPRKGFMKFFHGGGQCVLKQKPALQPIDMDLDAYDTLYIAAPVWAGRIASPMYSFLETYPVKDKLAGALFTSMSGNAKGALSQLQAMAPQVVHTASLLDESMKGAGTNDDNLQSWLRKLIHDQKVKE